MLVEVIPYRNFKEKIRIVKELQSKNMYIEIWENMIYASKRGIINEN